MISRLAREVKESPTLKMNEKANRMKEQGQPVIHLGGGEPKSKTPIEAILSAASRLNSGDIKYTPTDGIPSLKKAVIRYTEENYGRVVGPEHVIISAGAKMALYNLFLTILNPDEEVIITAPYWVSYPEMVKLCYAIPIIVTPEDGRYEPRIQDIEEAVTSHTKAVIVNSPNNPSGIVYSEGFIRDIVEFCEKKHLFLIMDDIYHKLVFDGKRAPSVYQFSHEDHENSRIVVINGISKLYGMTGFRIGWAIANKRIIQGMVNIQAQTSSCPSALLQAAAVGALNGMQSYVDALRLTLQNNRDLMVRELSGIDGVRVVKPDGTFYCLADFRAYTKDSVALSNFLLEKALVVTVPGKEFGMEGYLRLSYCGGAKDILEGCARIKWALDPKTPREIYIGDRKVIRDWK